MHITGHRQKVATGGGRAAPPARKLGAAVMAVLVLATLMAQFSAANAAPQPPDNVVVFPNRDFVSLEGFVDDVGKQALIQVRRPNVGVIGSAKGEIGAGDHPLEVNHPGGLCWGAGTSLQVTPDLRPGDVVVALVEKVPNSGTFVEVSDTTVQDTYVSDDPGPAVSLNGSQVVIRGYVGASVNKSQLEQRIINPDLEGTNVARRDVRATTPTFTASPNGSYQSKLEFSGTTFTATYEFTSATAAATAAAGQARMMAWQLTDENANRWGLTIAEFGELNGPGFAGCPNGPMLQGPPLPTEVVALRNSTGTQVALTWKAAVAIPGTPAITGYYAVAIAGSSLDAEQAIIGKRVNNGSATGTVLTGLDPAVERYTIEIRSISEAGESYPPLQQFAVDHGEDTVPPTVSASPAGGLVTLPTQVTLTANEVGSTIYYSPTGADLFQGGVLSGDAVLYSGPFTISDPTTITFLAFDPSGNVSSQGSVKYHVDTTAKPGAPTITSTTPGTRSVTLSWTEPDPGASAITGYQVNVYDAANTVVASPRFAAGTLSTTVTDLTAGEAYSFTVQASNVNGWGAESAKAGPVTPWGDVVANAGPDQSGFLRGSVLELTTAGSTSGATYAWTQIAGPAGGTLTAATSTAPATFQYPTYAYQQTRTPVTLQLSVTNASGSATDTVTLTPVDDGITITEAKWINGKEVRISGTASTAGALIELRADDGRHIRSNITLTAPLVAGEPYTWQYRVRSTPFSRPPAVMALSTLGGTATRVTTAN